jgi:thioredoxin reductase
VSRAPGAEADHSPAYDVVVVGGGPAGLAAALFLGRARRRVLVVDDGQPRNARARALHGFPTRDGMPPLELLRITRQEVQAYGVVVRHGRVVSARKSDGDGGEAGFQITVENGEVFDCRRLLLATGVKDILPDVEGMLRFYGRGVYHCPYCDGWEMRDKRLVAFGALPGSARLALHLLSWSKSVTLCTAGTPVGRAHRKRLQRNGIRVVENVVARLAGGDSEQTELETVVLDSGERVAVDALFLSVERVQHSDLAQMLGCRVDEKGNVRVRGGQQTGVPGLFVVGDAVGDVQFAVVGAGEGARAAVAIHQDLEKTDLVP